MSAQVAGPSPLVPAIRAVIVIYGLVTLATAVFLFPLSALLSVVAGIAAICTRGTNQRILLTVAILGTLVSVISALLLISTGGTVSVGPVTRT